MFLWKRSSQFLTFVVVGLVYSLWYDWLEDGWDPRGWGREIILSLCVTDPQGFLEEMIEKSTCTYKRD